MVCAASPPHRVSGSAPTRMGRRPTRPEPTRSRPRATRAPLPPEATRRDAPSVPGRAGEERLSVEVGVEFHRGEAAAGRVHGPAEGRERPLRRLAVLAGAADVVVV